MLYRNYSPNNLYFQVTRCGVMIVFKRPHRGSLLSPPLMRSGQWKGLIVGGETVPPVALFITSSLLSHLSSLISQKKAGTLRVCHGHRGGDSQSQSQDY